MNTFTSDWTFVQEYDDTYHTPKDMVGSSTDIFIYNPQIQWRGNDGQITEYYTNEHVGEPIGWDGNSDSSVYWDTDNEAWPDVRGFDYWEFSASIDIQDAGGYEYKTYFWSYGSNDIVADYVKTGTLNSGDTIYWSVNATPSEVSKAWDDTYDPHAHIETTESSNYADFTIADPYMTVTAHGSDTVTKHTDNPAVQGDVSASISNRLSDNETSSWTSLSGLQPNKENNFDHRYIDGSEQADFRIKFDWEIAISPPTNVQIIDSSNEGELTLDWDTSGTNANGYYVYRAQVSGSSKSDYTQVADVTSSPYTDTGLEDGEQYYYRVTSHD